MNWNPSGIVLSAVLLLAGTCPLVAQETSTDAEKTAPVAASPAPDRFSLKKLNVSFGPSASIYFPNNAKTRETFGDSWTSLGISVGLKGDEFKRDSVKLRIGSIRQKNDDSHAYIYPVGVSFSHKFMQTKKMSANVGFGTSLYLIDLYSKDANLDTGLKTGGGACVFVGTQLGKHVSLEASYNAITRMHGYDLSGLSLSGKILF